MALSLDPYQLELKAAVYAEWARGARNVVMRLDTGGGKTVILSSIILEHAGACAVIAHRHELLLQLSLALAMNGVRHRIIGAQDTIKAIIRAHIAELGRSFYDPGAPCAVISIDTLNKTPGLESWAAQVTLWIVDEGHHLVLDNKWHKGIAVFTNPHCRGLLPTATPDRADGKGLGRPELGGAGVADCMVQGPPMRWLIEEGFLTDYTVFCPKSDLRILEEVGSTGDWSPAQLKKAAKESHIVGDAVTVYKKFVPGKIGIAFATDVDTANDMAAAFNAAGIPAASINGKSDPAYRRQVLAELKARKTKVVTAVDIVSEGFDLPAIEFIIDGRPTQSLANYMQRWGRAFRVMWSAGRPKTRDLRLADIRNGVKPWAVVIDMVGNLVNFQGPPDMPRVWGLANRDKKSKGPTDAPPIKVCLACIRPFEAFLKACPHCGEPIPAPAGRSSPKQVEGELAQLDPAVLAAMRRDMEQAWRSPSEAGLDAMAKGSPPMAGPGIMRRQAARLEALTALRDAMGLWGGVPRARGHDDTEIQRLFWLKFGVDVMTAVSLGTDEANALRARVEAFKW